MWSPSDERITEHLKYFNLNSSHRPVLGPYCASIEEEMSSSDSRHSSDDSSGSDDPDQSSAVPNSLSLLDDDYAIDRDSLVDGTPQKQFGELDWQSVGRV